MTSKNFLYVISNPIYRVRNLPRFRERFLLIPFVEMTEIVDVINSGFEADHILLSGYRSTSLGMTILLSVITNNFQMNI